MNDGAACLMLVSEEFLKKHNLKAYAKITGAGIRGIHPNVMGLGPVEATRRLCQKFGKKITYEIQDNGLDLLLLCLP